jgi:hypothetical protein
MGLGNRYERYGARHDPLNTDACGQNMSAPFPQSRSRSRRLWEPDTGRAESGTTQGTLKIGKVVDARNQRGRMLHLVDPGGFQVQASSSERVFCTLALMTQRGRHP